MEENLLTKFNDKKGGKNVVDKIFDKNEKERKCHFIFTDKRRKGMESHDKTT